MSLFHRIDGRYFSECGPSTSVAAAPQTQPTAPTSQILATYGSWEVVSNNGQRMVRDTFDEGSKLMIGRRRLAFSGAAKVIDCDMVAIEGVSSAFMKALYHGGIER